MSSVKKIIIKSNKADVMAKILRENAEKEAVKKHVKSGMPLRNYKKDNA